VKRIGGSPGISRFACALNGINDPEKKPEKPVLYLISITAGCLFVSLLSPSATLCAAAWFFIIGPGQRSFMLCQPCHVRFAIKLAPTSEAAETA